MKKKLVSVLFTAMLSSCITGCASNAPAQQTEENPVIMEEGEQRETNKEPAAEPEPAVSEQMDEPQEGTKDKLEECFALIGKDDAAAAGFLGGGKENIAGDGVTKVGRIYAIELFGEEIEAGALYDENNCVYLVTMQLKNPDASVYAKQLEEIYGNPDAADDIPSETGSTWQSWDIGDVRLRLYQEYELSALEITKIPKTSGQNVSDTGSMFTGWLPQGVEQVMAN